MSNKTVAQQEGRDNDLTNIDLDELKNLAKFFNIETQRDWQNEDYIKAIIDARNSIGELASAGPAGLSVNKDAPPPGFARIEIHRDPTPGHANSPVPLGVNGRFFNVPRGIPCDVPIPYVEVLRNAVHKVVRQKQEPTAAQPMGVVVEELVLSYPFQVISITPYKPGQKFNSQLDQRSAKALRKEKFVEVHKRYPTDGELIAFEKMNLQREYDAEQEAKKTKTNAK